MDKTEFLKELEEIVFDKIYIAKDQADQSVEIKNNTWSISISNNLSSALTVEDFSCFINRVVLNRKMQMKGRKPKTDILFYLWFDEMAAQLKFNVISDYGSGLPFGCKIKFVDDSDIIIKEFLAFAYHNGIPLAELEDVEQAQNKAEYDNAGEKSSFILNVYCMKL